MNATLWRCVHGPLNVKADNYRQSFDGNTAPASAVLPNENLFCQKKGKEKGGERQFDKDWLSVGFASVDGRERPSFRT